jgi:spore maturation protein CgeB
MANPSEREKIAKAGQARTLKEHTIENRAKVVSEVIQKQFK